MKKSIKNTLLRAVPIAACLFALSSCEEWTQTANMDVTVPSLEKQNPELSKAYLQRLNDYKAGPHKVVIVTFDPFADNPRSQSQRLTALPDSIDCVSLNAPDNLAPALVEEMLQVRAKGTKVVYNVDYPTFEAEWIAKTKVDKTLTEADALAYFTSRTTEMLSLCDKWGYDGITYTYMGLSPVSMLPEVAKAYAARQKSFMDLVSAWRSAHPDKFFSFIGNPHFLTAESKPLLKKCDYIILPTEMALNTTLLEITAGMAVASGDVPSDRFVFRVHMFRADDKELVYGYYGTKDAEGKKIRSIPTAAQWMGRPSDLTRGGMMILGVQLDYFQSNPNWLVTRQAISTMNP